MLSGTIEAGFEYRSLQVEVRFLILADRPKEAFLALDLSWRERYEWRGEWKGTQMDQKSVRKLEREIEKAIAPVSLSASKAPHRSCRTVGCNLREPN
jgi:hypothetical protein